MTEINDEQVVYIFYSVLKSVRIKYSFSIITKFCKSLVLLFLFYKVVFQFISHDFGFDPGADYEIDYRDSNQNFEEDDRFLGDSQPTLSR